MVAVVLAVIAPVAWRVVADITESCEWSADDRARLESVPVDEFLGQHVEATAAHCGESPPFDLSLTAQLDESASLPSDWRVRTEVAGWTLVGGNSGPSGPVLCYTSTDERWTDAQVKVWSDGLVEVSIPENRRRCRGFGADAAA